MARIRSIKPEFWRSPSTAKASPWGRLLYIAMWGWADDHGRGEWTERELLAFAFPNDTEPPCTPAEFPRLLTEIADTFAVEFYTVRGRRYYAITSWDEHQKNERRAKSKWPGPDDPDATPDLGIHRNDPRVAEMRGTSVRTDGNTAPGTGEQGNRGTGEQGSSAYGGSPATAAEPEPGTTAADENTQTLLAEWIDRCDQRPPGRVIGQTSKEIKSLLDEGIPYADVRAGLAAWHRKGLHPATLPSVVHEVRNPGQRPSGRPSPSQRAADVIAIGERLQAQHDQQHYEQLQIGHGS